MQHKTTALRRLRSRRTQRDSRNGLETTFLATDPRNARQSPLPPFLQTHQMRGPADASEASDNMIRKHGRRTRWIK